MRRYAYRQKLREPAEDMTSRAVEAGLLYYRQSAYLCYFMPLRQAKREVYARVVAASEGRAREGTPETQARDEHRQPAVSLTLMPHEDEKDEDLAKAFIARQRVEHQSEQSNALFWTHERISYLTKYLPHKAWRVILLIWTMDQSTGTMQSLSAGAIEDLLSRNGSEMIPLVEAEGRRDPSFAKLLGGVSKNEMTDEVWSRLQAVWHRRGWDGIPEES